VTFNAITSPNFKDQFSIRLDKTFRKVFPSSNREVIEKFSAWGDSQDSNVLYSYYHRTALHGVYEDNKNRSFFDKLLKS
jgi:hypothetical protein